MRYSSVPSLLRAGNLSPVLLVIAVFLALSAAIPSAASIVSVHDGDVAWGDYDGDGDLDLLVTGIAASGNVTKLYRNDGAVTFTEVTTALPALGCSAAAWGDYDADRDLDLVLMGRDDQGLKRTSLFRNDNGAFTEVADSFLDMSSPGSSWRAAAVWLDYDNDGDLDLAISGVPSVGHNTLKLYRNDGGGSFVEIYSLSYGSNPFDIVWGDFTCDGKIDFAVNCSVLYRNTGSGFSQPGPIRQMATLGASADYDGDGRLDLTSAYKTALLHNEGSGAFTPGPPVEAVSARAMAWGHYDDDGDPDLFAAIDTSTNAYLRIYRNDGDVFTKIVEMATPSLEDIALGDCDNDGDVDIATLAGIYLNNGGSFSATSLAGGPPALPPAPPSVPCCLQANIAGNDTILSWSGAPSGLSYNVRIGTSPGASDILSGMAFSDGQRLLPAVGNASMSQRWRMTLPLGNYFWSVQAIDGAFRGSAWSSEAGFQILPIAVGRAKLLSDGTTVSIEDAIVTAAFGASCYIESQDRSHGLRVDGLVPPGMLVGDKVRVAGVMKTDAATERYLQVSSIEKTGTGTVRPLGMPVRSMGGSEFGGQGGIDGAAGLNNVGLLVGVCGRYEWSTIWSAPTIDDGSGIPAKCVFPPGVGYNPNWLIVKAVGISSCFKDTTTGLVYRQLKIRDRDSIAPLRGNPCTISGKVFNTGGRYQTAPWYRETAHPIPQFPTHPFSQIIVGPGNALNIRLHFTKLIMGDYEHLILRDGTDRIMGIYDGANFPDGYWSTWCAGNVLQLDLYTSGSAYSASWGFITDVYECEFDNPLAGATLTLEPGGQTAVTGDDGLFSFTVSEPGTYTIIPSYLDANFSPASREIILNYGPNGTIEFTRQ